MGQGLLGKATGSRKVLGLKCPNGFDSHLLHQEKNEVNYAGFISHRGTYHYDKGGRRVGAGPPGRRKIFQLFLQNT